MDKILWSKDFLFDIPSIDEQHKKIIDYINTLIDYNNNDISSNNIADIFDELLSYSYSHYEYEETLLKELKYSETDLKQHKAIHLAFKDIITELVVKSINRNNYDVAEEVLNFMRDWWVDHIINEDMKYKSFLEEKLY